MGNLCSSASENNTPKLHEALRRGDDVTQIAEILKLQVDFHAYDESFGQIHPRAIHLAAKSCSSEVVQLLLGRGVDIGAKDSSGRSVLYYSIVYNKDPEVTKLLFDMGAEAGDVDQLLKIAVEMQKARIAQLILARGADIEVTDASGRTPLQKAVVTSNKEFVHMLLDRGANVETTDIDGGTPLHEAVRRQKPEIVTLLLDYGANVEATSSFGRTALGIAAAAGDQAGIGKLLLERGAAFEVADQAGNRPLHLAAASQSYALVQLLLQRGADVEAVDNKGQTPLHKAVQENRSSSGVIELLLSHGAKHDALDRAEKSPFDLATFNNRMALIIWLRSRNLPSHSEQSDPQLPPDYHSLFHS